MTTISDETKALILADKEFMRQIIAAYLGLPKQSRTAALRCAVTDAEAAQVELAAKELHMNASEYMRFKVFSEVPENTAKQPATNN